jgi:hypothetical protein
MVEGGSEMATITYSQESTGRGGMGAPVRGMAGRPLKIVTGTFSFDNSYASGGEDISDLWNAFPKGQVLQVNMADPVGSAGTGKLVRIDLTNKKAMLYTMAAAEVTGASDQSGAVSLPFTAVGY